MKGWPHYEALRSIIPVQASSWVGFHAGVDNTDNTSTPSASATPGPSSASDIIMASLEDALDRVEFNPHTTNNNSATMHAEPGTSGPPIAPSIPLSTPTSVPTPSAPVTPIMPITPTSFNIVQDRPTPSTPASSTAVKRKAEGDDSSRHESRPPQSSKGKSSSKSQRLSMPSALEDFGGKNGT